MSQPEKSKHQTLESEDSKGVFSASHSWELVWDWSDLVFNQVIDSELKVWEI